MKFSPSQAFAEHGHVLLPGLAAVIGLTALISQWVENHKLRAEVEKLNANRTAAVQAIQAQIKTEKDRESAYIKDLNKWIDHMNGYFTSVRKSLKAIDKSTETAVNQKNALCITSMYGAGAAAGVKWKGKSKEALVEEVTLGAKPPSGAFAHMEFKVPKGNIDLPKTYRFISYTPEGGLAYDREGKQDGPAEPQETLAASPADNLLLMPKIPES